MTWQIHAVIKQYEVIITLPFILDKELICRQFKYISKLCSSYQETVRSLVSINTAFSLLRVDCMISMIQIYGIDVVEGRTVQGWRWITKSGMEAEEDVCAIQVKATRQKGGDYGRSSSVELKFPSDTQGFGMVQVLWAVLFGPNQILRHKRNGRCWSKTSVR